MSDLGGKLEEFDRLWASADSGDVDAMTVLATLCDGELRKDWLRRAADGGDRWSADVLADELVREGCLEEAVPWYQRAYVGGIRYEAEKLTEVLLTLGRLDEAEHWAGLAAEARQVPSNQCMLADVLLRLGKLDEAERWARRAVEERPVFPKPLLVLADVLDRLGTTDEAAEVREQAWLTVAGLDDIAYYPGSAGADVVLATVVSVAVVPFVKALMSRAGGHGYAGARALVKWLFERGRARKNGWSGEQGPLLIVEDPNPNLRLAIWLGTDTSDQQLSALKDLDLQSITADSRRRGGPRVRIKWDESTQSWRALDQ
jgi:tetratricopeptide (TPR) repeat protein